MAHASLLELEHHLLLASEVGYFSRDQVATALNLADQVSRMLRAMRARLDQAPVRRSTPDARRSS